MKRTVRSIATLLVIALCLALAFIVKSTLLPEQPVKARLIDLFQQNKSIFVAVANHLTEVKEDVSIDKRYGTDINSIGRIHLKSGAEVYQFPDKIKDDIQTLIYEYGFIVIYEEQSCIYFCKAVGFQWYQAIVYSKDGKESPLHRVREFDEIGAGWYYYYGE